MGSDRLLHRIGKVAQQVPGVRDLPGLRSPAAGAFGVGTCPVPADHLDLGMAAQPGGQWLGVPARQYIDRATFFQVHQDGGVRVARDGTLQLGAHLTAETTIARSIRHAETAYAGLALIPADRQACETAYDLDDAAVKKASIASARRTIVATDGGKLGRTAYAYVGPATLLHTLVTDTTAPAEEVAALEGAGAIVKTV